MWYQRALKKRWSDLSRNILHICHLEDHPWIKTKIAWIIFSISNQVVVCTIVLNDYPLDKHIFSFWCKNVSFWFTRKSSLQRIPLHFWLNQVTFFQQRNKMCMHFLAVPRGTEEITQKAKRVMWENERNRSEKRKINLHRSA